MARDPLVELQSLRDEKLHRQLRRIESRHGSEVVVAGQSLINFSSNDYLGLSQHPNLITKQIEATEIWGVGAASSRLICGTLAPHLDLESRLAEVKKSQAALTFSTGYATSLGTLTALADKDDILILDKLCHASLIDGARLSGATLRIYPHNDLNRLESHLQWAVKKIADHGRIIVITESVFSMDGDLCPLAEIVTLKEKYGALLLLDEAHAFGVIGDGLGLADQLGLCEQVDLQMGTLSKALGLSGGYLCASRAIIDLLTNRSRSFIYSTAPSAATAVTALSAIDLIISDEGHQLRQKLRHHISSVSTAIDKIKTSPSPILPLIIGSSEDALALSERVYQQGLLIPAIRYPTVPREQARLRITLSASHDEGQIEKLIAALKAA